MTFSNVYLGMQKNNRFYNTPSIFINVLGCNLDCVNYENRLCRHTDPTACSKILTVEDVKKFINKNKHINHIVFKGGEPLLYKREMENLLDEIWRDDLKITIYTNGTLPILNPLAAKFKIALYVADLRIKHLPEEGSKFTTKCGNEYVVGTSDITRWRELNNNAYKNIQHLCMYANDYLLYVNVHDDETIKERVRKMIDNITKTNTEAVRTFLQMHPVEPHIVFIPKTNNEMTELAQLCMKYGVKFNTFNN